MRGRRVSSGGSWKVGALRLGGRYSTNEVEGVQPRRMPVPPGRLHGVPAHDMPAFHREALIRVLPLRPHHVAEHIRLPATRRTGARAAELLQIHESLSVVVPGDG